MGRCFALDLHLCLPELEYSSESRRHLHRSTRIYQRKAQISAISSCCTLHVAILCFMLG